MSAPHSSRFRGDVKNNVRARAARSLTAHRPRMLLGRLLQKSNPQPAKQALKQLLYDIKGTQCGLNTPLDVKQRILASVDVLREANKDQATTQEALLSGTWRLLWTTEQETLFILKNAKLFGTQAGEVYQVVDVARSRLQNVITFPPQGAFIVDSALSVAGPQRAEFKFKSATLKLPWRDVRLPPFGQGWFDTLYVDKDVRVAQDVRGDTLVVARDGAPRVFE